MEEVENFPLWWKKKFYSKIKWIGTFGRGGKFSTFGGTFFTLVEICFWHPDLRVCQILAQIEEVENFPLWWKIFHFQKKKLFQNHMNWNILQRWKIFHFWWKFFHFGENLFLASGPSSMPNFCPNTGGKFSSSKKFKKKFSIPKSHELEHSA